MGIHFHFQSKSTFAFTQNPPYLNQFGEASELRLLVLEANNISFKGNLLPLLMVTILFTVIVMENTKSPSTLNP